MTITEPKNQTARRSLSTGESRLRNHRYHGFPRFVCAVSTVGCCGAATSTFSFFPQWWRGSWPGSSLLAISIQQTSRETVTRIACLRKPGRNPISGNARKRMHADRHRTGPRLRHATARISTCAETRLDCELSVAVGDHLSDRHSADPGGKDFGEGKRTSYWEAPTLGGAHSLNMERWSVSGVARRR